MNTEDPGYAGIKGIVGTEGIVGTGQHRTERWGRGMNH